MKDLSKGALRERRPLRHFVLYTRFAVALPMVGTRFCADHREDRTKSKTHHEVVAALLPLRGDEGA